MTVKELIIELKKLSPDLEIRLRTSGTTVDTPLGYVEAGSVSYPFWFEKPPQAIVGLYEGTDNV